MFSERFLRHVRWPQNFGELENANGCGYCDLDGRAPRMRITLRIEASIVKCASFQAFGCGAAIATCSALTQICIGHTLLECHDMSIRDIECELDGIPQEKMYCAELAILAFKSALVDYANRKSMDLENQ